ncbi:MAG: response regulator transcription factor [Hyphomonadaceae bacterium]|nr:response regulator transcription factor [Hyphomonadaceae bacterium]
MFRTVLLYGAGLALAVAALQWVEYQVWARSHPGELYSLLLAAAFLGLGVWVGARLFRQSPPTGDFVPNEAARASLGITDREREVLGLLAAGRSNKEIAQRLAVSPNTVKTHIARLYEKLEASRRTEAVLKARELRLIP